MGERKYVLIEEPDKEEGELDREVSVAVELFNKIMDDFSHSEFTARDVFDSFNDQAGEKRSARFNKRHLDYLLKKGMLDFNEKTKEYSINHSSSEVARIMEAA